jgi:beta-phosphoglucomutase family hydrolase
VATVVRVTFVRMDGTHPAALLPPGITACLFDLDGVLTRTAEVHLSAWKEMFDAFLRDEADGPAHLRGPFTEQDYAQHVDGRLRLDGVRAFLASRQLAVPEGAPDDGPDATTVHGLGARKNALVLELLERRGVGVYPDSVRYVDAVRSAGARTAVVSASKNCAAVLAAAGLTDRFEVRVDGVVAAQRSLAGKPAPDMFLAAAAELGVEPAQGAVYEDAVAGVAAGRAGGFGWVVGIDRVGQSEELRDRGADLVVADLGELLEAR